MIPYFFVVRTDDGRIFKFEAFEFDAAASWTAAQVAVRGDADGMKQGIGDDLEAAVLDAVEGLVPDMAVNPAFIDQAREQFRLQLVSPPA